MRVLIAFLIAFEGFLAEARAATRLVETEATILSGTAAVSNIIHIKYHAPLTLAR